MIAVWDVYCLSGGYYAAGFVGGKKLRMEGGGRRRRDEM